MSSGTVRRRTNGATQAGNKVGAQCYLETASVGDTAHLTLIGELDLSCAERFKASLKESLAESPHDVVIDLRSVTFIDSTGLALLLKADMLAREEGFHLHVVKSRVEIVQAVFEASGVHKILPLGDEPPDHAG